MLAQNSQLLLLLMRPRMIQENLEFLNPQPITHGYADNRHGTRRGHHPKCVLLLWVLSQVTKENHEDFIWHYTVIQEGKGNPLFRRKPLKKEVLLPELPKPLPQAPCSQDAVHLPLKCGSCDALPSVGSVHRPLIFHSALFTHQRLQVNSGVLTTSQDNEGEHSTPYPRPRF